MTSTSSPARRGPRCGSTRTCCTARDRNITPLPRSNVFLVFNSVDNALTDPFAARAATTRIPGGPGRCTGRHLGWPHATDYRNRGRIRHFIAVRSDRQSDPDLDSGGAGVRGCRRHPARQAHPVGLRGRERRCATPAGSTCPGRPGRPPIVDADEVGAANMILTNGARLYVDHAHPEYSAPECTDPMDAVIWDKAGERVMEAAARHVASVPGAAKLQLYKNNVDGKGASYGSHENYLMSRQTPFSAVIAGFTPFLVSRQVVTGSGRRRHRAVGRRSRFPAVPARPTTSRSRSAWRPRSSAASSTPATSRTPTPTSTGGCTSSSAMPTWPRRRPISRSAPARWCST